MDITSTANALTLVPLEIRIKIFKELDLRTLTSAALPGIHDTLEVDADQRERYLLENAKKVAHLVFDTKWAECLRGELERLRDHCGAPICPSLLSLQYEIDDDENTSSDDGTEGGGAHSDGADSPSANGDQSSPLLEFLVGPNLENVTLTIQDVAKHVVNDNVRTLARIAPRLCNVIINNYPELSTNYGALHQEEFGSH
ncbi:hypothetical protein FRB94_005192 [Tulasnella sp. JGI-2019a]|nr:hypothetical protein FRB93_003178 [Tulasnella sp. JGI-2019a]KAG9000725.1 hypothetical protein FRB94_005192 [Tulasnella sp. JGI-2019a]